MKILLLFYNSYSFFIINCTKLFSDINVVVQLLSEILYRFLYLCIFWLKCWHDYPFYKVVNCCKIVQQSSNFHRAVSGEVQWFSVSCNWNNFSIYLNGNPFEKLIVFFPKFIISLLVVLGMIVFEWDTTFYYFIDLQDNLQCAFCRTFAELGTQSLHPKSML